MPTCLLLLLLICGLPMRCTITHDATEECGLQAQQGYFFFLLLAWARARTPDEQAMLGQHRVHILRDGLGFAGRDRRVCDRGHLGWR